MTPAHLSAALRSVAERIDRSTRPSRSAVASELKRVLAAMSELEVSDSFDGPWSKTDEASLASECQSRLEAGSVLDEDGTLVYFRSSGSVYSVSSMPHIHGDDAMSKFVVRKLDESEDNDPGSDDFPWETDDVREVLSAI